LVFIIAGAAVVMFVDLERGAAQAKAA